ncbi:hypothetical protein ACFQQB_63415 [Nonomuraea rubra]|uniref:hypothetical protein n=1 Tax=Nonomuraea rubra TaxID=46180 RepID=UPI003619E8F3
MRIHRMPATLASVVALAACAVTLTATPAGASGAANPCGSGYKLVGSYTIAKDGTKYGTLEVRWSAATGKNCALAYGFGANYGRADYKSVRIETTGSTRWADTDWGTTSTTPVPFTSPPETRASMSPRTSGAPAERVSCPREASTADDTASAHGLFRVRASQPCSRRSKAPCPSRTPGSTTPR